MLTLSSTVLPRLLGRIPGLVPAWNIVFALFMLTLAIAYVLQISSVTMQGYAMRDLEVSVEQLQLQSEELSVAVAEAKSLGAISERMQILGFVEPDHVVYVAPSGGVAVAR